MTISLPIQRAAALGLLLVVLWSGWAFGVGPILDRIAADRQEIGQSEQLMAAYRRAAEELPLLQRQIAALRANDTRETGYLQGSSAPEVAAELQNTVQSIVRNAGAYLRSSQTLPQESKGQFLRIGLELEVGADQVSLLRVLYGIETARPKLFIGQLSIQAPQSSGAADIEQTATSLTLRLQLYGFMQAPGS